MRALAIIALATLAACGPQPRCNWHLCAPASSDYVYDPDAPGLPYSDVVTSTHADWVAAGLPSFRLPRVSVEWYEGPIPTAAGPAQAFLATTTRRRIGMVVRSDLGEAAKRSLIRHELVHAFGARAGLPESLDRDHSDRQRCPVSKDWCARD